VARLSSSANSAALKVPHRRCRQRQVPAPFVVPRLYVSDATIERLAVLLIGNDALCRPFSELLHSTTLGVSINAVPLENMSEFEKIAGIQSQQPNTGFVPIPSAFMTGRAHEVGALMVQHRLPALYVTREFAASGGLISYGNDVSDNYRRAAKFVDRILKGESPSGLPIELPVKFALIINLKTAKTLGLTVPLHMQQIADEVIE
jgi:ABC transporter substrate binding protein